MSKYKRNKCPTCDGIKAKLAMTCMHCYRLGKGVKRNYGKNPRYDIEFRAKIRQRIAEIKEEQNNGEL